MYYLTKKKRFNNTIYRCLYLFLLILLVFESFGYVKLVFLSKVRINNSILLYSCSSDLCTKDLKKVSNLKKCEGNEILELYTNGGIVEFNKKGEMKMLPVEM